MNKRKSDDKEKVDLMKWVNALKVHDPIRPNPFNICWADPCEKAVLGDIQLTGEDMAVGNGSAGFLITLRHKTVARDVVHDFLRKYCQ